MEAILSNFRQVSDRFSWFSAKSVGAPTLVLLILALLVVPLPAFLLDVLFTFNIMLGLLMVMITLNTRKPLEFSSFPSVLLIATLLLMQFIGVLAGGPFVVAVLMWMMGERRPLAVGVTAVAAPLLVWVFFWHILKFPLP